MKRALDIPAEPFQSVTDVIDASRYGILSVADAMDEIERIRFQTGSLVPASGGLETPFTYHGTRYLYCWHTGAKRHFYVNLDTDQTMPEGWYPGQEH